MRRRGCQVAATIALLVALAVGAVLASAPEYAFGGGGPGFGLLMPDLTEINEFIGGVGFAPLGGDMFLVGGDGRGGLVPGMAFGGAGWGAWIESEHGNLHAEYGLGMGGFDLGFAVDGSERSVLTLGTLFGGGAVELILTEFPAFVHVGRTPRGIVVEPSRQTYDSVFAFVAPYLDMQIQLLAWMGLGVRAGYLWVPFELNWSDEGPLDAPDLACSGLYVRLTLRFGGITDLRPQP